VSTCYKTDKIERFDSLISHALSLRPARLCRSFPSCSILDAAEFTLSERKRVEWARNDKNARLKWKRTLRSQGPCEDDTLILIPEFYRAICVIRGS
jgi:hypothetical protein